MTSLKVNSFVLLVLLAVALPGVDPMTTLFELLPLLVLFEASIWLSVLFERRWRQLETATEYAS